MFPVTRLFESEHAARDAVEKLIAGKIARRDITVINAQDPNAAASLDAAVQAGSVMSGHRRALNDALRKGRTVVSVNPEYGRGSFVEVTLNNSGAVDSDTIPDYLPDEAAPFSNMVGLPVLTEGKSHLRLVEFDKTSSFGFRLLSKSATPLSSMFRMKVLSSKKGSLAKGSAVERMSGTPAPFSSRLGLKLLTKRKRAKGSSVERMSGRAAPLSESLGLSPLSRRK